VNSEICRAQSTALRDALALSRTPIGVAFSEAPPVAVPLFEGRVAAGCVFWERAAQGPIVTTATDHDMCSIGIYTHNLSGAPAKHGPELETVLKVLNDLQYVRSEDLAQIPVLHQSAKYVIYAPLDEMPAPPDAVLVFCDASQSLVMSEAVQQVESGAAPAMGRPACAVIPQVVNNSRAALSLGCCGARAYLDTLTDDIALWALPGTRLAEYADRITILARANKILSIFHQLRKQDVAAGSTPTYAESMARMQ
jgi:uncharacterized protein (DUF169 family)